MAIQTRGRAHSSFKALLAATLLLGSVTVTSAAHAINAPKDKVVVEIDKRDLKTDAGVERVYSTLAHKAKASCTTAGAKPISQRMYEQKCAVKLLTSFVENIDNEKLNAYHYNMQTS